MDFFSLCFDIDGSISLQSRLASSLDEIIDLRSEQKHLRLWAKKNHLTVFQESIEALRRRHRQPWLTFLGSGDFHHLTLPLLETLPKEVRPITLVLIDNHPDWFAPFPQYHCGNWVSGALRLPWVRSVLMVGQNSPDLNAQNFFGVPFRELCEGKVQLYPYERKRIRALFRWPSAVLGAAKTVRRFYGVDLYFHTVSDQGIENLFDQLAEQLMGQNIYISIDKDCLERRAAITDWEQGKLSLKELLAGIGKLKRIGNVIGVDVCGERAPYPLKGFLKRIDSGRIFSKSSAPTESDYLNEQTNLNLLKILASSED